MLGFSCPKCTRIFEWPAKPAGECLPPHLDMLIGVPCRGTGDQVLFYT